LVVADIVVLWQILLWVLWFVADIVAPQKFTVRPKAKGGGAVTPSLPE